MSFAFRGISAEIAGTTSSVLVRASDKCATLQSTLAHAWGSILFSATIPFTRRLSRSSKRFVLRPASSWPLLFHIASLWYEADAWKWLKIGPSIVCSKTFTNSSADFASFILTVNLFASTFFQRLPPLPPPLSGRAPFVRLRSITCIDIPDISILLDISSLAETPCTNFGTKVVLASLPLEHPIHVVHPTATKQRRKWKRWKRCCCLSGLDQLAGITDGAWPLEDIFDWVWNPLILRK